MIALWTLLTPADVCHLSPPGVFPAFNYCCNPFLSDDSDGGAHARRIHERFGSVHLIGLDTLGPWQLQQLIVQACGRRGQFRISRSLLSAMPYRRFVSWSDSWKMAPTREVCWHGERAFVEKIFEADPLATIRIPMVVRRRDPNVAYSFYKSSRTLYGPGRASTSRKSWQERFEESKSADYGWGYRCFCEQNGKE